MIDIEEQKLAFLYKAIDDTQQTIRFIDTKVSINMILFGIYVSMIGTGLPSFAKYFWEMPKWLQAVFIVILAIFVISVAVIILIVLNVINPKSSPTRHIKMDYQPKGLFYLYSIGVSEFNNNEFNPTASVAPLCAAIKNDGLSLTENTVKGLNILLKDAALLSKISSKKNQPLSPSLMKIKSAYEQSKDKRKLIHLNRAALEEFYPGLTPGSHNSLTSFTDSLCDRADVLLNPSHEQYRATYASMDQISIIENELIYELLKVSYIRELKLRRVNYIRITALVALSTSLLLVILHYTGLVSYMPKCP